MTPEAHFITLCVREPHVLRPGELHSAATAVGDWAQVASIAFHHRVAAFVTGAVQRDELPVPESAARAMQQATLMTVAHGLRIDLELKRVLRALEIRGVPVIVFKGPVLARTLYPRTTLRPYNDFDLTVHHRDEHTAAEVILACGFREVAPAPEKARRQARHAHGAEEFHRMFESSDGRARMDLHVDSLQLGLKSVWAVESWQRALPAPGLPSALMLCPEDQIIQLSVHAHKHGFSRLSWIKDLDLILRTYDGRLDWDLVIRVARQEGIRSSIWLALALVEQQLKAPIPAWVLASLRPTPLVRALYALVWPIARIADLQGQMRRRAVQCDPRESLRGIVPGLVLMGRRRERARAALHAVFGT